MPDGTDSSQLTLIGCHEVTIAIVVTGMIHCGVVQNKKRDVLICGTSVELPRCSGTGREMIMSGRSSWCLSHEILLPGAYDRESQQSMYNDKTICYRIRANPELFSSFGTYGRTRQEAVCGRG